MGYARSSFYAKLIETAGAATAAHVHGRDVDLPGLNLTVTRNIERASPGNYISSYDSAIHGSAAQGYCYTIDAFVQGDENAIKRLCTDVNKGGLFKLDQQDPEDKRLAALMEAAKPVAQVPLPSLWRLDIEIVTLDQTLIVKNAALPVLANRGTWIKLHGETSNSSNRCPGSGEFSLTGMAGFLSRGDANAAYEAIRGLGYDFINVVKLYNDAVIRLTSTPKRAA